jgi:hypothetical protein
MANVTSEEFQRATKMEYGFISAKDLPSNDPQSPVMINEHVF